MKAKKSILAVAAAATVMSGLPFPVLADEEEPKVPEVTKPAEEGEPKDDVAPEAEVKKVTLKFIDDEGTEVDLYLDEDEFNRKYVHDIANGEVVFDLSGIPEVDFKIHEGFAEANPGITTEFDEAEGRKVLKVSGLTGDLDLPVVITSAAVNTLNEPEEDAVPQNDDKKEKAFITVKFVGKDGKEVGNPYSAEYLEGNTETGSFFLPKVKGYEVKSLPTTSEVQFTFGENGRVNYSFTNISVGEHNIEINFEPSQNEYKVNYYFQNVNDDDYTLDEERTETKQGLTDAQIDQGLAQPVDGFYALNYDKNQTIAADGTTEVSIYYNRNYVLVKFNLDGGYGVEPIYEKYGAPLKVNIETPLRGGYSFNGWKNQDGSDADLPETVPANDAEYFANWSADKTSFTVVYWGQNADDDGYSYLESETVKNVNSGSEVSPDTYKNKSFDYFHYDSATTGNNKISIKGDGTTVLNVYYNRNTYVLKFYKSNKYNDKDLVDTIEARYEQDIASQWPTNPTGINNFVGWKGEHKTGTTLATKRFRLTSDLIKNGAKAANNSVTRYYPNTDGGWNYQINYYVESLDGTGVTYKNTKFTLSEKYSQNLKLSSSNFNYKTIEGLKAFESGPVKNGNTFSLYYVRNRHNLSFSDGTNIVKTVNQQMFEMPFNQIKDANGNLIKDYIPELPSGFEKGAFEFGGWYTTPECYDQSKVDFSTMTMPDSDTVLYAKWVPVVHTIKTHQLETHVAEGNVHKEITGLPHGKTVDAANHPENPTYGNYEFQGWFHKDGDKEKAFDFNSSVVNKDLNLYAKYRTDVLVTATVKYVTMVNGEEVEIAEPTTIIQLATTNATVNAKGDTDLYEGYQEGYFPTTKSTNINFDPEGTLDCKFVYESKEAVPYTVKYVRVDENGNETPLLQDKDVSDNKKAVVTEIAPAINDHIADAYSKRLVVSTEEGAKNVITFYYSEDMEHAFYTENHWLDLQPTTSAYSKSQQALKTDKVKPDTRTFNGYELDTVDYTDGTGARVTYTAEQWSGEDKKEVGNGAAFDFHYKAVYYIHYSHIDNPVKREVLADAKDGYNAVENVSEQVLYAGLFHDAAYQSPYAGGSENGLNIKPSTPGQHYYVKTISRNYMKPSLYYVYNRNSKKIDRLDAFTFIDGDNYSSISNGNASYDASVNGTVYDKLEIIEKHADGTQTIVEKTATDFFKNLSSSDKLAGGLLSYGYQIEEQTQTYTLKPYYITKDGIRVYSRLGRTYTIQDRSSDKVSFVNHPDLGDTTSVEAALAARTLRCSAAYQISNDLPTPEQPEVPAEEEQPEAVTISVTKVVNGNETIVESEKGDIRNSITPDDVSGSVFAGWFTDSDYTSPADLTNVEEDITIYGRYVSLSEIGLSASSASTRKSTVTANVACQLDHDVLGDVQLNVEYDGKVIPVSLNKQTVSVGSFFEKLLGRGKKVTEYSGQAVLENVKGSKEMKVTASWITADGTEVTGPAKTFVVTTRSIR